MSEASSHTKPNQDQSSPHRLIYRGITKAHDNPRMGAWWTTNPYYALRYSDGGEGTMFVALVDPNTLAKLSKDASIDEGYENYLFPTQDPPGARQVTPEEIEALKAKTTFTSPSDLPGGGLLIKWPEDAVEIGQAVFAPKELGPVAVAEALGHDFNTDI